MMKRIFLMSVAAFSMLFAACGDNQELMEAQQKADSLQTIVDSKDAEIDALFEVLNDIEANLTEISTRYSNVRSLKQENPEVNGRVKGEINEQLAQIEAMLSSNKEKMAKLNAKIAEMGNENSKLSEYIVTLNERIQNQEQQIDDLMKELNVSKATIRELSEDVSDLTQANQEKDDYIAYQTSEANKAYYIVGSYKDLKEMGIVDKSGGFIGIGKKQSTTSDMDVSKFQMIDRTKVTTIPINQRKAQVISRHPEGSYELVADENDPKVTATLVIKNVKTFWQYTNYLVVSTNK